jgi:uncharacterized membrane protein YeiB
MKFLLFGLVFAIALYTSEAQVRTREELLRRAEDLEIRAKAEVEKLRDAGKTLEVAQLEREERVIATLATELRNAHAGGVLGEARLRALETSLTLAESRLEAELRRLEGSTGGVTKRDVKADLLLKTAELLTKSNGVITLLESQGKPLLAAGVKTVEKFVMDIEKHLEALHPTSELGKMALTALEGLLKTAETKLEDELKKLGGAVQTKRDLQGELLTKAAELLTKSNGVIALLESQGKPLLAAGIKTVEKFIIDIENHLKNLHPSSEIGKLALTSLEGLLKTAEDKLEAELKKIGSAVVKRDVKADLLTKTAELLTKSNGIISLLESQGKPLLAAGVKTIEKFVIDIEQHLQALHPTSELGKMALSALEGLLKTAENKLEDELKKISGAF